MSDTLLARHRAGDALTQTQIDWVVDTAADGSDPIARAHVAVTAAETEHAELAEVQQWMNDAPDVAAQWYISALDPLLTQPKQRRAYGETEPLYKWMLNYTPPPTAQPGTPPAPGAGEQ